MLLWMYGMVGIIVWMWKCDCTGKQWRDLQNRLDSHSSSRSGRELSFERDISLRREGLA